MKLFEKKCTNCKKPATARCAACKKPLCKDHAFKDIFRDRLVCIRCEYPQYF